MGLLIFLSSITSPSPALAFFSSSVSTLPATPITFASKSLNGFRFGTSFASVKSITRAVRAVSDSEPVTGDRASENDDDDDDDDDDEDEEQNLPVGNLPLDSKLLQKLEQKMKMKLAKKVRLRRKKLLRKRRMRKKGRWPPSKMNKLKNV